MKSRWSYDEFIRWLTVTFTTHQRLSRSCITRLAVLLMDAHPNSRLAKDKSSSSAITKRRIFTSLGSVSYPKKVSPDPNYIISVCSHVYLLILSIIGLWIQEQWNIIWDRRVHRLTSGPGCHSRSLYGEYYRGCDRSWLLSSTYVQDVLLSFIMYFTCPMSRIGLYQ